MERKMLVLGVVASLLVIGSVCQATVVYMDASLHNGALTAASTGGYWSSPQYVPAGWYQDGGYVYQAGLQWALITSNGKALNNTGELVPNGHAFTIQADLGGFTGYPATVNVYATQNVDGTGDKVLLTSVSRMGNNTVEGYNLYTVSNTGLATPASVTGYYVQVALEGSGYYDNIVVTSAIPEPITLMLLGLGGFFLRKRQ